MPTLKNKKTGVVIDVDDELAAKLGSDWVKPSGRKGPAKKPDAAEPDVAEPDVAEPGEGEPGEGEA